MDTPVPLHPTRSDRQTLDVGDLLALSGVWYWEATADLMLRHLSENFEVTAGVSRLGWIGQRLDALIGAQARPLPFATGKAFSDLILAYQDSRSMPRLVSLVGQPVKDATGQITGWRGAGRDITAVRQSEQRLVNAEELLSGAMESISEGFALYGPDDRLLLFNQNYNFFREREVSPIFRGALFEDIVRDAVVRGYYPAARGREDAWIAERVRYHRDPKGLFEIELHDGRWLQIIERRTPSGGTVTINTDITALKRRDDRMLQAQKLQALGELTGGVAHDFSNVLLMLECNLDLIEQAVGDNKQAATYLEGAHAAIKLAGSLTQRLLAVARLQPLQSKIVDVNELVQRMNGLLTRTLPRSIRIETVQAPGLWRVLVDESQLETAILNLSLNARDAMPVGGTLKIETTNVFLQQSWADHQHELRPGSYVVIAVSDNGAGMTRDVASRALEPFFTTKTSGKGSGLGLSMAYGFIKQSGGDIEILSKLGAGTTVKLFLPRVGGDDPFDF